MLKHKGTITLETPRLVLRKFKTNDTNDMFNNWATDTKVTKFLSWDIHKSIDETKGIIDNWIDEYKDNSTYNWIIESKDLNKAIGAIGVVSLNNDTMCCEIGYCLGSKYWNKGIMTESLKAVISFLFNEVGMNRIEAVHDTKNIASGKVMVKSGMKYEGTLREIKIRNNEFYDLAIYSILKSESHEFVEDTYE